jgi:hypothetical protein
MQRYTYRAARAVCKEFVADEVVIRQEYLGVLKISLSPLTYI